MKLQAKKIPLGRIVTIASFVAFIVVVAVVWGNRTFAQNTKILDVNYSGDKLEEPAVLNKEYVDNETRTNEFFDGQKCVEANLDCFTKQQQTSQMLGWTGNILGTPEQQGSSLTTMISNGFGMLYQPIASGQFFVADAFNNMGIATNTYAQGYGYYSLAPFLSLWRVFRNLSYVFFTVIIIAIGFLILFRQKIGNQAAVTAQQALPRIVIALILVTFSYAIAGFMIDLMYWIMYAFANFTSLPNPTQQVNGNFGDLTGLVLTAGGGMNAFSGVSALTKSLFSSLLPGASGISGFLGWIGGVLGVLIMTIVMVANLFRLLFTLLKSYAIVLLNIIFAPLNLMLYAIPGVNTFKKWIMSIIANLSPFVIVFFMLIIVGVLNSYDASVATAGTSPLAVQAEGWVPPYINGITTDPQSISMIVSLAIMLALPELVENIKKKLGGGEGFFGEIASAAAKNATKGAKGKIFRGTTGAATGLLVGLAGKGATKVGSMRQREQKVGVRAQIERNKAGNTKLNREQGLNNLNMNNKKEVVRAAKDYGFTDEDFNTYNTPEAMRDEMSRRKDQEYANHMAATKWTKRLQARVGATRWMKGEAAKIWGSQDGGWNNRTSKEIRKKSRKDYFKKRTSGSMLHYGMSGLGSGPLGVVKQGVLDTDTAQRIAEYNKFSSNLQKRKLATRIINEGEAGGYTENQIAKAKTYLDKVGNQYAESRENRQGL